MVSPIGQVFELSPTDKLPTTALKTIFGVGGGGNNQIRTLLLIGACDTNGSGTLVPDTETKDVIADGDEITLTGSAGNELARMVAMSRRWFPDSRIKIATVTQTSTAAATATITIGGSWTVASSGPVRFRIGGRPVEVFATATDTATTFGDTLAAAINNDPLMPVTAVNSSGAVALTCKSYGTRGNDLILWKDDTYKPSGMTVTLGGDVGGTVSSAAGPWALADGETLVVAFNAGGDQTFTIHATAATITGSGATYASVTAGHTLTLTLSGTQYVVTFTGSESTQAAFHATINAVISVGGNAANAAGQTKISTSKKGSGASGTIDAGDSDVLASLGLSVGAFTNAGPNNVANVAAVTAAEWVTIMSAITNGTAANNGGALKLTSATTGSSGTVQVKSASTADTPMSFDNSVHSGGSGAGPSVASGGVRFTGGTATEDVSTLFNTTLAGEPYWTIVSAIIDATNLGRIETAMDTKCGPLVRLFGNVVVGSTKTLSASTSLAQTTLDNVRFQMVWMEEGETPAEEMAAWMAALRHQREQANPNQKYDTMPTPFVPQEAASKRMSRSTQVAALDVGLTCIPTKNNVAYVARAITTRSLTSTGAADDGTIDVGEARTPDVINEDIGALWEAYTAADDPTAHHYLRNDPAPGEEADIPAGTTYPKDWAQQVQLYMKRREGQSWVVDVDTHPTVVAMNPTSSTPRFVQYTPVIVAPQTHQLEGTIAQTKFVPQ